MAETTLRSFLGLRRIGPTLDITLSALIYCVPVRYASLSINLKWGDTSALYRNSSSPSGILTFL